MRFLRRPFTPSILTRQIQKVLASRELIWHDKVSSKALAWGSLPSRQTWLSMTNTAALGDSVPGET